MEQTELLIKIDHLRLNYLVGALSEDSVDPNPIKQFGKWFQDAQASNIKVPHAMTLSTSTKNGMPSGRIVLLTSFDNTGFVFYTNYNSRKSKDLAENPKAAILFYWDSLERQVRIQGDVEKISKEESEKYFKSLSREHQIAAWASPNQSSVITDKKELDNNYKEFETKFQDQEIPKPDFWGGWKVKPSSFEFWQGRSSRLHDRILYSTQNEAGEWKIQRLSP